MNHSHWMHLIIILQVSLLCSVMWKYWEGAWLLRSSPCQAAACILRGIVLFDILGCFWMGLICALGWYAWYHDSWLGSRTSKQRHATALFCDAFRPTLCSKEMNITYISLWGLACALNTLLDTLGFIIPVATGLVKLELLSAVVRGLSFQKRWQVGESLGVNSMTLRPRAKLHFLCIAWRARLLA